MGPAEEKRGMIFYFSFLSLFWFVNDIILHYVTDNDTFVSGPFFVLCELMSLFGYICTS